MRWKKIDKIFDPTKFDLPLDCKEFSQSPQALVFDDFIRVYFSSREKEERSGKYLSHICFVEYNMNLTQIIRVSNKAVIKLGNLGCYDEHGIFPLNVLRHDNYLFGYIGGWNRRVSVSVDGAIGLAVSKDEGLTFERIGDGPILAANANEPFLIGDPFVKFHEGKFYMWYIYGTKWMEATANEQAARVYKIAQAISDDGRTWQRNGRPIIPNKLNAIECQALPTVFFHENKFHMIFCYRQATGFRKISERGYRLGYAYSTNLTEWFRDDVSLGIAPTEGSWDSDMMCYPHVFQAKGQFYLLYNGNDFGRFGFGLAILE